MPNRITNQSDGSDSVRYLNQSHEALLKTIEKLSSGWRVNRASDDPAALVISEQLRSRIASLNQEIENTTMMIRKYETAESVLGELRTQARSVRVMVEAASDVTTGDGARDILQTAVAAAAERYSYLVKTASYNGTVFFDGSEGSMASLSPLTGIDTSSPEAAVNSLRLLDQAEAELYAAQVDIGAVQKYELEARRATLEVTEANLTASEESIRGSDVALDVADMIREKLQMEADIAMMFHAGMNRRAIISILFGD
jgi:flagellin